MTNTIPLSFAFVLRRRGLVVACFIVAAMGWSSPARGQGFSDGFEAPTLDTFWVPLQQSGNIQLVSGVSHSGSQSVRMTAAGSGQHNIWLSHRFPRTQGTLSVWIFDSGPGIYAGLYASDSSNPALDFASNVADWNAAHYIWHGPGVSETASSVARSVGWHELKLEITASGFKALVDNVVTGSVQGDFTFDTVLLLLSGPGGESGTFYFDDFAFCPINSACVACAIAVQGDSESRIASLPLTFAQLPADSEGDLGRRLNDLAHGRPSTATNPYWGPVNDQAAAANLAELHSRIELLDSQVASRNGSLPVTSAYRPGSYQSHLGDVKAQAEALPIVLNLWRAVLNGEQVAIGDLPTFDACREIATALNDEIAVHAIGTKPPRSTRVDIPSEGSIVVVLPGLVASVHGPHTQGVAADAAFAPSTLAIDDLASAVGLIRPPNLRIPDPNHFVLDSSTQSYALLRVMFNSPILGTVTDPNGRRIGFDTASRQSVNEIGNNARYSGVLSEPQTVEIENPIEGVYSIDGMGTGDGPYTITAEFGAGEGQGATAVIGTGVTAPGQRIQTRSVSLPLDVVPPLKCDANGDGVINAADLLMIRNANGQVASGPDDPRDGNGDGAINVSDVRYCQLRQTPRPQ